MGLFRRRETYNERLLREAGLDPALLRGGGTPSLAPPPSLLATLGIPDGAGVGPNDLDTCVAVTAPGLAGDRIRFTTLPNGDAIVEEEEGSADVSPLADAVEEGVQPPYKAFATRQDGDLWAVGAKRIEVVRIELAHGDELELTRRDSWDELRVDREPSDAKLPQLEQLRQLGERAGSDFYVKAERIDGDLWEVRASPL